MMSKRPSMLNLSDFPVGQPVKPVNIAAVEEAAGRQGFSARDQAVRADGAGEGTPEASVDVQAPSQPPRGRREKRTYRTGRTESWSVKASPETLDTLYRVIEQNGWSVAEGFERAVAAFDAAHGKG